MYITENIASSSKFSYQRLRSEGAIEAEREGERAFISARGWFRLRKLTRRKWPRVRIPGLRRFLVQRKARFISAVRVSWGKAMKRLKKSQLAYLNDLFGGNYTLVHFSCPAPTTVKCGVRPYNMGSSWS